ncbi:Polyketide cyclase / dehydrase and lipid transport [Asanoa hainanensis]|uniref:Polyketide cyclase / dehydrase and lipid transport n=1 Tax=Asanoa hainanensis TaxID=560556 RepID=A0A239FR49_9ACTN|nr:SRPBCC family protein [Asanoa hainanensis]SNS59098.1 Polyketide cyclase / dehydrase and lipid transport [Asanoa hainanensis]
MSYESLHLSVAIERPPAEVYAFVANPENLPRWTAGLTGAVVRVDERWVGDTPDGPIVIMFAPPNPFGVLDHDVTFPSGQTFYNPMRVFANADGSEVVFTVFRREGTTPEAFEADAAAVLTDLRTLKSLME